MNDQAHRTLGLVQLAILSFIDRNPDQAYGSAITSAVSLSVGRELADAQVYVALSRMEGQGLVGSRVGIPMPSKTSRGRPRKYYALTATGRRAMESAGAYTLSNMPFKQSTSRGDYEGKRKGPKAAPVVA